MHRRAHAGPGLAKCGVRRPLSQRVLSLVRCADSLWQLWFEKLDVVSEGLVAPEHGVQVYRGTTSLIVLTDRHGGLLPHEALAQVAQVAARDPHFWLRATRAARLEAVSRSPGPLGCIHVELNVSVDPKGIRADIDVDARLAPGTCAVKKKR